MSKRTVVHFTAEWVPGEKEEQDPNMSVNGMIQVVDGKPTNQPAHLVIRDYSDDKPCWWPLLTLPTKKQLSYGPDYGDEELYKTNLHEVKIEKNSYFHIASLKGETVNYKIVKVDDLTA